MANLNRLHAAHTRLARQMRDNELLLDAELQTIREIYRRMRLDEEQ